MSQNLPVFWKKCSTCKKPLAFSAMFYVCSVSTCKHPRKGFQFCSVDCWDAHLGFMNHREAWAEEARAPSQSEFEKSMAEDDQVNRSPVRKIVEDKKPSSAPACGSSNPSMNPNNIKTDTLIVVSKVKALIAELSGYNTSQCCVDALTRKVIGECLKGVESAKQDGRKTVMGRDIK